MEEELRKLKNLEGEIEAEIAKQTGIGEFDQAGDPDIGDNEAGDPDIGDDEADTVADSDNKRDHHDGGERSATAESDTSEGNDSTGSNPENAAADGAGQAGLADFAANTDEPDDVDEQADADGPDDIDDSTDADNAAAEQTVAEAAPDDGTIEIVADQRELDSHIARDLSTREGVETRLETLEVGDYVLSDRVVVERKEVSDFLETLVGGDRSMFEQIGAAARHYARPVVIIEGDRLYETRNVHPNAIRGAIASLAVDFGASVLRTTDADDTADLLEVIARREQETDDRAVSVHGEKGGKTLTEQQEYVVGSVAEVGPVTARSLLEHFGSVEAVMCADGEALLEVDGIGEVTADRITGVTKSEYANRS